MLRSMYSGIGGMRGFQTKLDVIGNNIANVNTVGFKKSRVVFSDILSQTISGGNAANSDEANGPIMGGTNPKQVGLGSTLSAIDVIHTTGSPMTTGNTNDFSITGNGFFVISPIESLTEDGDGNSENFLLTRAGNFTRDSDNNLVLNGMFVIGADGKKVNLNDEEDPTKTVTQFSVGEDGTIVINYGDGSTDRSKKIGIALVNNPAGLEKVGGSAYRVTAAANGNDPDSTKLKILEDGGTQEEAGVYIGSATALGRGKIIQGQLEMSNVDLSEEFTEMIVAQRGFQANSRIITTSDSILEELVNLKR